MPILTHTIYNQLGQVTETDVFDGGSIAIGTQSLGSASFPQATIATSTVNGMLTPTGGTLSSVTKTFYDAAGHVVCLDDHGGQISVSDLDTTTSAYDALNRKISETRPDPDGSTGQETSPVTQYGYDLDGNLLMMFSAADKPTLTPCCAYLT